jgi:hypothetical protein
MFGSYFWSDMFMPEKSNFLSGKWHVGLMASLHIEF